MGGCLHWVVREGFSKEGMFKQTFDYEKNLPCEYTRILPTPEGLRSSPKGEKSLVWSGNRKKVEEAGTQEVQGKVEDVSGATGSQPMGLRKPISEAGFYLKCSGAF